MPHAVMAVLIDFKSAFNRVNHNIVVTILSKMGVPGWLLRIVAGFLTHRGLIVRHRGLHSEKLDMPGSTPQGTLLGLFLFLILINSTGCGHPKDLIGKYATSSLNIGVPLEKINLKYIDDMTQAFAFNVHEITSQNNNPTLPLSYHERTGHIVSEGVQLDAQLEINRVIEDCKMNEMVINISKTKVMMFNTSRKRDFLPELSIGTEHVLEVVSDHKLLGIIVQEDLRWAKNTLNLCRRGFSRLWMLRRLRNIGASRQELCDVYIKQVRSVLEIAVPAWEPGLTKSEGGQLERVQKSAFSIILGDEYESYEHALEELNLEKLSVRRSQICLKFAKKALKHPKYQSWFKENTATSCTRARKNKLVPVNARTKRYERSPLPYLTHLLNLHLS